MLMDFIRVYADDEDYFNQAETEGYLYGKCKERVEGTMQIFYVLVYVDCRINRADKPSDHLNTKYKRFVNCTIKVAIDEKSLEEGRFKTVQKNAVVELLW